MRATISLLLFLFVHASEALWTSGVSVVDKYGTVLSHPNLKCWLHEDNLQNVPNGAPVSSWPDKSNAGPSSCLFQVASGSQTVLLSKNAINGHSALSFDSTVTDSYLVNGNSFFASTFGNGLEIRPFTAFFVAQLDSIVSVSSSAPYPTLFSLNGGNNFKIEHASSTSGSINYRIEFASTSTMTTSQFPKDQWHIICVQQQMSVTRLFIDGTSINDLETASASMTTELSPAMGSISSIYIGRGTIGTYRYGGLIAEALMYNDALTTNEIDRIGFYLASRFDLVWRWIPPSGAQIGGGLYPVSIQPQAGPVSGQKITIKGDRLMPQDCDLSNPCINNVMITAGIKIPLCGSDTTNYAGGIQCAKPAKSTFTAARLERECTSLQLSDIGYSQSSPPYSGTKATFVCNFPEGIGQDLDVVIRWFGIPYVISGISYQKPILTGVFPSMVSYKGGVQISVTGQYFGPGNFWVSNNDAGKTSLELVSDMLDVQVCTNLTMIDSSSLTCIAPPLMPKQYRSLLSNTNNNNNNNNNNLVALTLQLRIGSRVYRSTSPPIQLTYTNVPSAYKCSNNFNVSDVSSLLGCRKCCSEQCLLVDSQVTPDLQCESYCGSYCRLEKSSGSQCDPSSAIVSPYCFQSAFIQGFSLFVPASDPSATPAESLSGIATGVSPTVLSVGSTVLTIIGNRLTATDKVKIINYSDRCGGSDDGASAVAGGVGRPFASVDSVGTTATATFVFSGSFFGQLCYLPASGLSYVEVRGAIVSIPSASASVAAVMYEGSGSAVTGSFSATILGSKLSGKLSPKSRIGGTGCMVSTWLADCAVLCKVPTGSGQGNVVAVSAVLGNTGSLLQGHRYASPYLSSAVFTNAPATASNFVTLLGAGYRTSCRSVRSSFGGTTSMLTSWVSTSAVLPKLPKASGSSSLSVRTSVSPQMQAYRDALISTNANVISSATRLNTPPTGSASITVIVTSNLNNNPTVRTKLANTPFAAVAWTSHTSISCKTPRTRGPTSSLSASMLPTAFVSTLTQAYTNDFNGAVISAVGTSLNVCPTASISITIFGNSMGVSQTISVVARIGRSRSACSKWSSDSTLMAKTATRSGTDNTTSIVVTGAGGSFPASTLSSVFTYDTFLASGLMITNAPITGSYSITFLLRGGFSSTLPLRVVSTRTAATSWVSQSAIIGKTVSVATSTALNGRALVISVASYRSAGNTLTAAITINQPSIKNPVNTVQTGALVVLLTGCNYGSFQSSPRTKLADSQSVATTWFSDTMSVAKAPGLYRKHPTSRTLSITTFSSGTSTITNALSYNQPLPSVVLRQGPSTLPGVPTTGAVSLTMLGLNLNSIDGSNICRIGGTSLESRTIGWASHTQVTAKAASGQGIALSAVISAAYPIRQGGTATRAVTYVMTGVSSAVQMNVPITGSVSMTMLGLGFVTCRSRSSIKVRIGASGTPASSWVSSSTIQAKAFEILGPAQYKGVVVTELLNRVYSTSIGMLTMNGIVMSSALKTNAPSTGSTGITLLFSNAGSGVLSRTWGINVYKTSSMLTVWTSSTSILAKTPTSGSYQGDRAVMTIGVNSSPAEAFKSTRVGGISIDRPIIRSSPSVNAGTTGAMMTTIVGIRLGAISTITMGMVTGVTASESRFWISDTCVAGKRAQTTSLEKQISSTMLAVTATITNTFTMDKLYGLVINARGGANVPSSGGQSVTLSGARFITVDTSNRLRLGATGGQSNGWVSDSAMMTKSCSQSFGNALPIASTVYTKKDTRTNAVSFLQLALLAANIINRPVTGSISLTLISTNTGKGTLATTISRTSAPGSVWTSQTSTIAKIMAGWDTSAAGANAGITLTTASPRLRSTITNPISIDLPLFTAIFPKRKTSATGGFSITMISNDLRRSFSGSIKSRLGQSAAEATAWLSESAVLSKSGLNAAQNLGILVSMPQYDAKTMTNLLSTDTSPTSTVRTNTPVTGSMLSTMLTAGTCRQLLLTSSARLITAFGSSRWLSSTSILVKSIAAGILPPSYSAALSLVSTNSISLLYTHDRAETYVTTTKMNTVLTGGNFVTMTGNGYGSFGWTRACTRYARTSTGATYWFSQSSVLIKMPSAEPVIAKTVVVSSVRDKKISLTNAVTVDNPIVSSMVRRNNPPTGGISVTVLSQYLATRASRSQTVRFTTASPSTQWTSSSAVMALSTASALTGDVSRLLVGVTGSTAFTSSRIWSFDWLFVSSTLVQNSPVTGSVSLTMYSVSMNAPTSRTYLASTKSEATKWVTTTHIIAKLHGGHMFQVGGSVAATCGGVVGSFSLAISYPAPSGFYLSTRANVPLTGSISFTVGGYNIPKQELSLALRYGSTGSESLGWGTMTSLFCKVNRGEAKASLVLALTMSLSLRTSFTLMVSYDSTFSASSTTAVNAAATGGSSVTIVGRAGDQWSHPARIGKTAFASGPSWMSNSAIRCKASAGMTAANRILVTTSDLCTLTNSFTFIAPGALSSQVNTNCAATGSVSITLLGYQLSGGSLNAAHTIQGRSGTTAGMATNWVSHSNVLSKVAPTSLYPRPPTQQVVTLARSFVSLASAFSTNNFVATALNTFNTPITASTSITIWGTNHRSGLPSSRARIQETASLATDWDSSTSVLAKTPSALSNTNVVNVVSLAQGLSSMSRLFSVDVGPGKISSIGYRSNIAYTGAISITIVGTVMRISSVSMVGFTKTQATNWASNTVIRAKGISSTGVYQSRFAAAVTLGAMTKSSITLGLSHDLPTGKTYTSVGKSNFPSSGAFTITMFAACIGLSPIGRVLNTATGASVWISGTSVNVKVGAALRLAINTMLTNSGSTESTLSQVISYDRAIQIQKLNVPKTAAISITFFGSYCFGPSENVVSLGPSAAQSTAWFADSSVVGKSQSGYFFNSGVAVTTGPKTYVVVKSVTLMYTMDQGIVASSHVRTNVVRTASMSVTFLGISFNPTISARFHATSCTGTIWTASTSIGCKTSANDVNNIPGKSVVLTTSRRTYLSSLTNAFSTDAITVMSSQVASNVPSTGSSTITLVMMLSSTMTKSACMRINRSAGSATNWISSTCMNVKAPMWGAEGRQGLSIVGTVGGAFNTKTNAISLEAMILTSSKVTNTPSTGGISITLLAMALGSGLVAGNDCSPNARKGSTQMEASSWLSMSCIRCRSPAATGTQIPVSLTVGGLMNTLTNRVSHETVVVGFPSSTFGGNSLPYTGSVSVTTRAIFFGYPSNSPKCRVGLSASTATSWMSATTVVAKMASGVFIQDSSLVCTAKNLLYTITAVFTFVSPSVTAAVNVNAPATGSFSITLLGSTGPLNNRNTVKALVMRTPAEACVWASGSSVIAKRPQGKSEDALTVYITLNKKVSASYPLIPVAGLEVISYDGAVLSSAKTTNIPRTGGFSVTMLGLGYGGFDATAKMRNGATVGQQRQHNTASDATTWINSTSMKGKISSWNSAVTYYPDAALAITVKKRPSTVMSTFTYQ